MGLGAAAESRGSLNPDNLVMPSSDEKQNFQVVCSSGPWETTELVRETLKRLAKFDERGLTALPCPLVRFYRRR
jgi:hypothetical protein